MLSALKRTDPNPFIAKKQAGLRKSFTTWKKRNALQDAHDLAWYFYAAGNAKTARSIVDEIADHVMPMKDTRTWGAAAEAICSAARFAREAKDKKREHQLIARIVETPVYVLGENEGNRSYFRDVIRRNMEQLVAAPKEKRAETTCAWAANSLSTFVYYAETLRHGGFHYEKWLDRAEIERLMTEAVGVIQAHIAT